MPGTLSCGAATWWTSHANGPQIGALERYLINGAAPNTRYQVVLMVFENDCAGDFFLQLPTVILAADKHGNAHGGFVFLAESIRNNRADERALRAVPIGG